MANEIDTMIIHNVMSLMNSNEAFVVYFASINWTFFFSCSIANKDENKQKPTQQPVYHRKEEKEKKKQHAISISIGK